MGARALHPKRILEKQWDKKRTCTLRGMVTGKVLPILACSFGCSEKGFRKRRFSKVGTLHSRSRVCSSLLSEQQSNTLKELYRMPFAKHLWGMLNLSEKESDERSLYNEGRIPRSIPFLISELKMDTPKNIDFSERFCPSLEAIV